MPEPKSLFPLIDLKGASAGTIAHHLGKSDAPRYRRRLAAELVRRITVERRRRERLRTRIGKAQMDDYRLDRTK
jgi:hypothetical protein